MPAPDETRPEDVDDPDASGRTRAVTALLAPGLALLAGFAGLLASQPVATQPRAALAAWVLACLGWAAALTAAARRRLRVDRLGLAWIVGVALVVRLAALAAPASDDVHRYLWEARVVRAGHDPYVSAPDAPELSALAADDPDQSLVNHPDWTAIYPPVQQWLQVGVLALHDSVLTLKLTWLAAETLLVLLLFAELRRRGRDPLALLTWLWCPLVVLVGPLEGHHDVVAALGLVAALVAHGRAPNAWPTLFALAVCSKPLALAALPALLPRPGEARRPAPWAWWLALVLPLLAAAPFLAGGGLFDSLLAFGRELHTGDVLPHLLSLVLGRPAATWACGLAGLLWGLVVWHRGPRDAWTRAALLVGALLLLLPTVHLWYPLLLLPLLVLVPWRPWLWVVAAGPLSWLTWIERGPDGPWVEWPWLKAVIWAPLLAWLVVRLRVRLPHPSRRAVLR